MAYELVTGPENCLQRWSRCGISDPDICAKAAARKSKAPESELSYSGNRRTGDYTL
ncbi:MAG: hypothetical protein WBE44_23085 [Terriglobales bacterium]